MFTSLAGFSLEAARAGTSGGGVGETLFDGGSAAAGAGAGAELGGADSSRVFTSVAGGFVCVCACACTCDDPVSGSACFRGRILRPGSESFEVNDAAFSFQGVRVIGAVVLGSSLIVGAIAISGVPAGRSSAGGGARGGAGGLGKLGCALWLGGRGKAEASLPSGKRDCGCGRGFCGKGCRGCKGCKGCDGCCCKGCGCGCGGDDCEGCDAIVATAAILGDGVGLSSCASPCCGRNEAKASGPAMSCCPCFGMSLCLGGGTGGSGA